MEITEEEILAKGELIHDAVWKYIVYSELFSREVEIHFCSNDFKHEVNIEQKYIEALKDFLRLNAADLISIKQDLWKHCNRCIKTTSYAINDLPLKPGQSEEDSNREFFGLHSIEDAFEKSNLKYIWIDCEEEERGFAITFRPVWEDEHGISILFEDGYKTEVLV
jgi:hypothetical protein